MPVSSSRKQQITTELQKIGIEATDEALASVIEILKSDSRKTPKSACKAYAQKVSASNEVRQKTTAKPSDGSIKDGLGTLAGNLKDSWKQQVVSSAIVGLVKDLQMGNYGELNSIADEELKSLIDADFTIVEACDIDPKYLLPSPNELKMLSSAEPIAS